MHCLADLKQLVKPGLTFHCTNYIKPELCGERIVTEVAENGFWYLRPGYEGRGYITYADPTLLSFDGDTVTFWRETSKAVEPNIMLDFTQPEDE